MKFAFASICEAGPRSINEDAVGCWPLQDGSLLSAVADGLGGMGGGEYASAIAIETISDAVQSGSFSPNELTKVVEEAHRKIREKQIESQQFRSMATTLSVVRVYNGGLYGVHCGDTRVMVIRGRGIRRLTKDQTEATRLLDQGKITKNEYRIYPRKNILYSALGGQKNPDIQFFEFPVEVHDWILITSDGVHQRLSTSYLRDIALRAGTPSDYVKIIRDSLDVAGAVDNFSAVVIAAS